MAKSDNTTPLMRQYNSIKAKYPDAILLFRVGDFYETFDSDAVKASEILGITLTKRAGAPLAGIPYHALDNYLPRLVRAGQRVAICEQLEDPKTCGNKIVKRGITELITPGVSLNDNVLDNKSDNYAACLNLGRDKNGIAFLDISTGDFLVAEGSADYIDKLLVSLNPKEVLYERSRKEEVTSLYGNKYYLYPLDDWAFEPQTARERLLRQFSTTSLKGFGIEEMPFAVTAAGALMHYLDITQHTQLSHILRISRLDEGRYVWLDTFTVRNLEIFTPLSPTGKTLLDVIDKTSSPQGGRLLKHWIALPLRNVGLIEKRLAYTQALKDNFELLENLRTALRQVGDIERLVSKISTQRVNPRDVNQMRLSLECIAQIRGLLANEAAQGNHIFDPLYEQLNPCTNVAERIGREIVDDPPLLIAKGNFIRSGVDSQLDELRDMSVNSKEYLSKMRDELVEQTGITSLKLGNTGVFGYYLEVRNTHKDKVPQDWIRKQTLTDAERYITPELKEYEEKILTAEDTIQRIEERVFSELVAYLAQYIETFLTNAKTVATIDCLCSYAQAAIDNNYCRPIIDEGNSIDIKAGRHPVIEKQLPVGEEYIPNDVFLDNDSQQIMMITGPNMAGKSALLRQTALIMLMAQAGSFVPAESVKAGYVDKVFTRVGASDNISSGESTFMVEMNEAAGILNNMTPRSLVLFDELGRGTSTYDGISIAQAIVEYIHEFPKARAKTLFATHYHELNDMEANFPRIKNFNVSVKEMDGKVIFMRKLVPGGSEHSFGIHVAKLAGMPPVVVERANEIMKELESGSRGSSSTVDSTTDSASVSSVSSVRGIKTAKPTKKSNVDGIQLSFFNLEDPVLMQIRDEIKRIDINTLTPIEALNKLNEIKKICGVK
ncbi:MAG: DNA mismatch repair protein MutS [Bacteroidales bacterium]|nr:DNA mismatch repair protein MutS [Bacteroidales bacterium]